MTTTQNHAVLEQGRADQRELRAQLQQQIWNVLNQEPGALAGEAVPWKAVPHIVVDALSEVMLGIFEALIAYDPANELPAAKHAIEMLRSRLGIIEAMSSPTVPKC